MHQICMKNSDITICVRKWSKHSINPLRCDFGGNRSSICMGGSTEVQPSYNLETDPLTSEDTVNALCQFGESDINGQEQKHCCEFSFANKKRCFQVVKTLFVSRKSFRSFLVEKLTFPSIAYPRKNVTTQHKILDFAPFLRMHVRNFVLKKLNS